MTSANLVIHSPSYLPEGLNHQPMCVCSVEGINSHVKWNSNS
ncbi:hypothetical protein [Bacillus sp. UNC438CL73TsuS30]|nr:hypothetical protein [Bacillus sp. UNC438CL73TsuS30]